MHDKATQICCGSLVPNLYFNLIISSCGPWTLGLNASVNTFERTRCKENAGLSCKCCVSETLFGFEQLVMRMRVS